MPKATGQLKRGSVVPVENHGKDTPTLSDIGITKKLSMRAQQLYLFSSATLSARSGE